MAEYTSRKKRWMPELKVLFIALCVLICVPSTEGGSTSIEFGDNSVDRWEFLIGASSKEIKYDFCKYNATSGGGEQCKNFPKASVDFEKVCNCTIRQNETNEGPRFLDLNCNSNLSYCPKKLSLTYEQGSYVRAPPQVPDPDVATSGINGWLVVSIISTAVNVLLLTTNILCLINDKVRAFLNAKCSQFGLYLRSIYSRIRDREPGYDISFAGRGLLEKSKKNNESFEIACRDYENIDQIVSTGKRLGNPKGKADLGFFEDFNKEKRSAHHVCVLVVHHNFNGIREWQRDNDKEDVETLRKTFYENRNCYFRSLLSPRKDHLLQLLSDEYRLLSLFDLTDDVPSVLVLAFLSHGKEGGKILTDHWNEESNDFEHFTTKEVYDALAKLNKFETTLKLINFCVSFKFWEKSKSQPCRGGSDEETCRSESCQITSSQLHNTAVIFSTVDSTSAPLDSTFVQRTCENLDTIKSDTTLLNALTMMVQRKVFDACTEISADLTVAKAFFISKGKKIQPAVQMVSEIVGTSSNPAANTKIVENEPLDDAWNGKTLVTLRSPALYLYRNVSLY